MATCSRPSGRPTHDFDVVETAVRDDVRIADLTHLGGTVEHRLYRIMWTTDMDGFLRALAEHDLIVEEAMGTDTEWAFQLRAPDREPLVAFHTAVTTPASRSTSSGSSTIPTISSTAMASPTNNTRPSLSPCWLFCCAP